jgi:WD40 repeat protein
VRVPCIALGLAACYAPDPPSGVPCNAAFECPIGQTCDRSASPPICGFGPGGPGIDAPVVDMAQLPDTGVDGGSLLWGPPVLVMQPVGSEDDPTLTADLLELYFNRDDNAIWRVTRATPTAAWGTPIPVTEFGVATTPELEPDGLTIYLGSNRTGTAGGLDIFIATRQTRTDVWSAPVRVPELCTVETDSNATVTADHLSMVFARRSGAARGIDVFTASRAARTEPWSSVATLDALNSTAGDGDAMLTDDKLSVFYYSTRSGGGGDLYFATRADATAAFGAPQPIAELNSATAVDQDPWISPDGHHLFFSSNRTGTFAIYESTR